MRISPRLLAAAVLLTGACAAARPARAEDDKPDPVDAARGYVGYEPRLIQSLSDGARKQFGISRTTGVYIYRVIPGCPAEKAGLKPNDVLLKVAGEELPDVSKLDGKDDEAFGKWLKNDFKKITSKIKPGDKVEMAVERAGTPMTVTPVAVTKEEFDARVKEAEEEANAPQVPDPTKAGPANAAAMDFEGLQEGKMRPDDLVAAAGYWEVLEEEGAKNHVLKQKEEIPSDKEVALVTGDGRSYADGTVACRFMLLGGMRSASGGLAFRAATRKDYYAVCADGVSRTFAIIAVEKNKRRVVASVALPATPKLKEWHKLTVTFAGKKIEATFDGTLKVSGEDAAFSGGWAGFYCEQDAETDFDDWKAAPK